MRYKISFLIAALTATACTDSATERSEIAAAEVGERKSVKPAEVTGEKAPSDSMPGSRATKPATYPASPSVNAATRDTPSILLTMPAEVQGKWRRSSEASVTAAQCADTANSNMGLILTIRPDGFSRFEDGGRLIRVHHRDSNRIRATFDTTYADTPTQGEFVFEARDDGQTLIERQFGDGAQSGTLRYSRCP